MPGPLTALLFECLRRGNKTAFVHWKGLRPVRWSYADIVHASERFARELSIRGIGAGDRVILQGANRPEWVAAFFGCLLNRSVVVPLDRQSTSDFVERVQNQVDARLVVHDSPAGIFQSLRIPQFALDDLSELADLARQTDLTKLAAMVNESDLVEIIFTSGTTSEPKGVRLTHKNFRANLDPIEKEASKYLKWEKFVHPIRFLSMVPLSHVFGQFMGMFIPMHLGGEVYFRDSFQANQAIETIKRYRISVLVAVPRMFDSLRQRIERDQHRARFQHEIKRALNEPVARRWFRFRKIHNQFGWKFWAVISGGASLSAETEEFFRALGFAVLQGYGMTETASVISIPHPFKMVRHSIGKPLPDHQVGVAADGEILVRGPSVSSGYWKSGDDAGLQALDKDGWFHTGDLGTVDVSGNVFFKGRKKETIVLASGLKIFPEDLEAALNQQPEVEQSAVVSVEGPQGPEPFAAIILKPDYAGATSVQDIVARANATLSEFQHIRRWMIWPERDFPRTTSTQKVIKRLIAERADQHVDPAMDESVSRTGGGSLVLDQIKRITGVVPSRLDAEANLSSDLKLDSLARMELLTSLEERFQIELDEAAVTTASTLGDLERMVTATTETPLPGNIKDYPYPAWTLRWPATWVRSVAQALLITPLARILGRVETRGADVVNQIEGPVLFLSNHVTAVDPVLIATALSGARRRKLAVAMAGELLRDWRRPSRTRALLLRTVDRVKYVLVACLFNVFPMPQTSGFRRSFAYTAEAVERGYSILVFPEGIRTKTGLMSPFRAGTGLLMKDLNIPVVPVKISGLFELKQAGRRSARYGDVRVSFLRPVFPEASDDPEKLLDYVEVAIGASEDSA